MATDCVVCNPACPCTIECLACMNQDTRMKSRKLWHYFLRWRQECLCVLVAVMVVVVVGAVVVSGEAECFVEVRHLYEARGTRHE